MGTWHYEKQGVRYDNIEEDIMLSLIHDGTLDADTLVWQQGLPEWRRLAETSLNSTLSAKTTPPPLPANKIPSTIIWFLAFAPLLGYLLECFIAGASGMTDDAGLDAVAAGQFWYVTLLLNIALSYLDDWKLKQAGINTKSFGSMAWLVPVYLWKRASYLKTTPSYFWVWVVTFVMIMFI